MLSIVDDIGDERVVPRDGYIIVGRQCLSGALCTVYTNPSGSKQTTSR